MRSDREEKVGFVLTRKERQLLAMLEGNPGRCFSRSYLLRTIWGYSAETRTRTVDVHVSRLHKKLQGRRNILIHTVVGQGYILEQCAEIGISRIDMKLALHASQNRGEDARFSAKKS